MMLQKKTACRCDGRRSVGVRYCLDDDAAMVPLFRQVLVHVSVVGSLVIFLRATEFDMAQDVFVTEWLTAF